MARRYSRRRYSYEPDGLEVALKMIVTMIAIPIGFLIWLFRKK